MRTSGTDSGHGVGPRAGPLLAGGALLGTVALFGMAALPGGGSPPAPPPSSSPDTVLPWEMDGDPDSENPVERGAYLARAGNCVACHTREDPEDEDYLAGGNPIESPFGTFYGTNITPHPEEGIGGWEAEDLVRAMHEGRGPDGTRFYPVFPYPSFARMTREDVEDLHAFLERIPPRDRENREHDLQWFAGFRGGLAFWQVLHHDDERFREDPERSAEWNRGAYLAEAVAHCAECHTPRTLTGGLDESLRYAGTEEGAGGDETVPNITPDEETGIGDWSPRELVRYLEIGMDPDGDFAGGSMAEVISEGTSYLTEDDLEALAEYLFSLEPIPHEID